MNANYSLNRIFYGKRNNIHSVFNVFKLVQREAGPKATFKLILENNSKEFVPMNDVKELCKRQISNYYTGKGMKG